MVFDLDPGPPATIVECCRIGLMLRDLFAEHGLECFAKTSGFQGAAAVRAAEHEGHLRRDQGRVQGPGPALRGKAPRPRRAQAAEGAPHGSRAHRLEPERPVQDHRQRLFAARTSPSHRVDAGDVGRGRELPQGEGPEPAGLRFRPGPQARRQAGRPVRAGDQEEAEAPEIAPRRDRAARPPWTRWPTGGTAEDGPAGRRRHEAPRSASSSRRWRSPPAAAAVLRRRRWTRRRRCATARPRWRSSTR